MKRVTNLKTSCINNASEPPKEKNSRPQNNYQDVRTTLLNGRIQCFLAKAGNSFTGALREEKNVLQCLVKCHLNEKMSENIKIFIKTC